MEVREGKLPILIHIDCAVASEIQRVGVGMLTIVMQRFIFLRAEFALVIEAPVP